MVLWSHVGDQYPFSKLFFTVQMVLEYEKIYWVCCRGESDGKVVVLAVDIWWWMVEVIAICHCHPRNSHEERKRVIDLSLLPLLHENDGGLENIENYDKQTKAILSFILLPVQ